MNQKGGVGKTTTVINLGHALALLGKKTLLLDMDPQGQVATGLGLDNSRSGMDDVLINGESIDDKLVEARANLTVVPAGTGLAEFEMMTSGGSSRGYKLKQAIDNSSLADVDFVLIDCPPSTGLLGLNAMFAVDEMIVPVSGDYLSLQGLSKLMQTLKRVQALSGKEIVLWLASTRMQMSRRLTQEVRKRILKYFPGRVFQTMIKECVALAESPSFGKSIFDYKKDSKSAEDYQSLAQDLISGRTS
jgi:chromosome partitioning protein